MIQQIKTFIKEMMSNPDGTGSSKRVAGWIVTFHFMAMCWATKPDYIVAISLGAVCTFWGLTSLDYNSFIKSTQTDSK